MVKNQSTEQKKREIIGHLILKVIRMVSDDYLRENRTGSAAQDVLLCIAVGYGEDQGRPMTPANIGAFIGMPRASAVRRLKELEDRGLVRRLPNSTALVLPEDKRSLAETKRITRTAESLIHRASQALLKMDTNLLVLAAIWTYS